MNLEPEHAMSHPSSISNASVEPVRHLDELEELLIDAEIDDEQVQHTAPVVLRPWLLLLGWCWWP